MSDNEDDQESKVVYVFPRKLIKKLLLLYRELNCLWDRNCPQYKNKVKRLKAIKKLTALVQEYDPNATRVHVMRKLESLRACVRREYRKVQESRETARNENEVYKPSLWYYKLLSFAFSKDEEDGNIRVQQQEQLEYEKVPDEKVTEVQPENFHDSEEDIIEEDQCNQSSSSYQAEYLTPSIVEVGGSANKRFSIYEDDSISSKTAKRHCTEVDDEYDAIGLNVAAKLRSLPVNMRILAEKLINDVLFQAQMNGLSSNSTITTQDTFIKNDPLSSCNRER